MTRVQTSRANASRVTRIFATVALVVALVTPVHAAEYVQSHSGQSAAIAGSSADAVSDLWFVQLAGTPVVRGGNAAAVRAEQSAFRSAAAGAGLHLAEKNAFQTLWNGLAVRVAPSELGALSRLRGVTGLWPVVTVSIPETSMSEPDLAYALAMTGADAAQSELGLSGAGVKVAIMDTGIDYHHADLGGCFGTGCRVITGHDFVGDAFNASGSTSRQLTPRPDRDPDDCNGHGTHVAGIVGAKGAVTGVAPGVTFGAYRVFGCEGSTTADIMIAAMERALADGMDVLNMSIGSAFQWPSYPTATAASNLVDAGMVVVASIGNSGANGAYSSGAPGNGDKVIGVASFDNTHVELRTFTVTPADLTIGYASVTGAPEAPTTGSLPLAKTGTPTTAADACNVAAGSPFTAGQFTGQAVLIRRGTCTFHEKALNAQNAGAAAVVLYNNAAGRFSATVAGPTAITIPVVSVSDSEGVAINNAIVSGPQTLNWTNETGIFLNPSGGLISSFSSYGLAPDLTLKPDIGAPGGLIRSTYPLELGGYATISGTSMSSPHVAGAVALYLEAHPATGAVDVRTIMQNSADPQRFSAATTLLQHVHRQGAGMVDIPGAVNATAVLSPGKIALGEQMPGAVTVRNVTVRNDSAEAVTYAFSHASALSSFGNTFTPSAANFPASVTFSPASVTVAAGATATTAVTFAMPSASPTIGVQLGGYLVATGGGATLRVPYAAFRGDYQAIAALTPTTNELPWLAKRTGRNVDAAAPIKDWTKQTSGATFTLKKNVEFADVPWVLFHLDHQVSRVTIDVYNADNTFWGRTLDVADFGRNSTAVAFFSFQWDGKAASLNSGKTLNVKNGSYYFKLTILKALGDPNNAAHLETWTSPTFTVEREIEDATSP